MWKASLPLWEFILRGVIVYVFLIVILTTIKKTKVYNPLFFRIILSSGLSILVMSLLLTWAYLNVVLISL